MEIFSEGGIYNAGLIKNVSVITKGNAVGHDKYIDDNFLQQVLAHMKNAGVGTPAYLNHPSILQDRLMTFLGKFTNPRLVQDKIVADLNISKVCYTSPYGDIGTSLLNIAKEDPTSFGFSINSQILNTPNGLKLIKLKAIDLVKDPAANPNGLFSSLPQYKNGIKHQADTQNSIIINAIENALLNDNYNLIKKLEEKNIKVTKMEKENLNLAIVEPSNNVSQDAASAPVTEPSEVKPIDYKAIVEQIMAIYEVTDANLLVAKIMQVMAKNEGNEVEMVDLKAKEATAKTQALQLSAKLVEKEQEIRKYEQKTKMLLSSGNEASHFKPQAMSTQAKVQTKNSFLSKIKQ